MNTNMTNSPATQMWMNTIWQWLVEPSASIQELERRRRARLLSGLLIPLAIALALGVAATATNPVAQLAEGAALIVVLVAYVLSRTRHYTLAAMLTVAILSTPSFAAVLAQTDHSDPTVIFRQLVWLVLPLVLGSLWFSISGMITLIVAEMGSVLLLPMVIKGLPFTNIMEPLGILGTLSALALIGSGLRQRDVQQIQQQLEQIQEANRALNTSERRFRQMADNIREVFWLRDATSNRMLYASPAFETIWGHSVESLYVNSSLFVEGIHPDDRERVRATLPMQKMGGYSEEYRVVQPDGSVRWVQTEAVPVKDERGNVYRIAGISRDMTAQRQAQLEVSQFFHVSLDMLAIAGLDGYFKRLNPTFETTLHFTPEELLAKPFMDFVHPGDMAATAAEIEKLGQGIPSAHFQCRFRRKEGDYRWLEWTATPVPEEGLIYAAASDITESKETQERLQSQNLALVKSNRELAVARRQAEEATRLKSEFLATMSHELRTPLNAIIGYSDIQLKGMVGELSKDQQDVQGRIMTNAEHLLYLINNILDLAKIESGRTEIIRKPFSPATLLEEVVYQSQGLADAKGLKMETALDNRLPEVLVGDPDRLRQIALNLVSNGIKFTQTGSVKVEFHKQERDSWALIVTDTGIGIPSHAQEYIFDEFRQVDGSSERKHGGTGLGLAIVRNLAMMMGGTVRVKSEVGKGSAFTITLPLVTQSELEEVPAA